MNQKKVYFRRLDQYRVKCGGMSYLSKSHQILIVPFQAKEAKYLKIKFEFLFYYYRGNEVIRRERCDKHFDLKTGPDNEWTLERTNQVWHQMRNLLQSKTTDVIGSITLDECDQLLNVKKISVESGDQDYIKETRF